MTKVGLLESLKEFTQDVIKDLLLPVRVQKNDAEDTNYLRAADVYMTRLPEMKASDKKAPYIIHSVITSRDSQSPGEQLKSSATIRSVFCVYNEDEQEGGLALLNLTERMRLEMLRRVVIDIYELDLNQGIELLIYPDDTAPYYIAEMVTVWNLPPIKREVKELW